MTLDIHKRIVMYIPCPIQGHTLFHKGCFQLIRAQNFRKMREEKLFQ